MSEELKIEAEALYDGKDEELKTSSVMEDEDVDDLIDVEGKTEQEIRDKIAELKVNLPTPEPGARKRPPKPFYTSVAHTFRKLFRDEGIDFKEFKRKWGETKPKKGVAKKKHKMVQGYMLRPEYQEAQKVYNAGKQQNRNARNEYKEESPNAYKYWTEMRKITKLENSINPVIQEERRKKDQAKRVQLERDDDEEVFNRRSKKLRFIPDNVSREMVFMERDVTALLFRSQEEFQKTINDLQKQASLRFQQGYDLIVSVYKSGLMSESTDIS